MCFHFITFAAAFMNKGKIICIPKLTKDVLEWLKVGEERGFGFEVDTIYVPFQPSQPSSKQRITKKPGAKDTYFSDFIINDGEADWMIDFLKNRIDKDKPKLAAYWVMAAIEAGKISSAVTAPCIEREFGVKAASMKDYLRKYRDEKTRKQYKDDLKPYVSYLKEQEQLKNAS